MNMLLQTLLEEFRERMKTFTGGILRDVKFSDLSNKI